MRAILGRKTDGHLVLELSVVASLICVAGAFCANLATVSIAASAIDLSCRDAARAAAQASDSASSLKLAQTAVKAHQTDGYFISQPTVSANSFVYQDFAGNPPANTSPYVSVTTTSNVRLPAPVMFWGVASGTDGTTVFTRTYTFPIVKTQLYLQ